MAETDQRGPRADGPGRPSDHDPYMPPRDSVAEMKVEGRPGCGRALLAAVPAWVLTYGAGALMFWLTRETRGPVVGFDVGAAALAFWLVMGWAVSMLPGAICGTVYVHVPRRRRRALWMVVAGVLSAGAVLAIMHVVMLP